MKKLFSAIVLICAVGFVACNSGDKSAKEVYTFETLMADIDNVVGDTVSLQGLCLNVCGHGSNHVTLMGDDTTQMIEAMADDALQSFSPDVVNSMITVKGVVNEEKIDTIFLNDWEFKLDESLKGTNGNPEAVAVMKVQIREIRDSIASRNIREGKNYWSIYKIIASEYATAAE